MITISNILDAEKHLDNIDAVVFDLDDTLYSEKEYVKSGYRVIAKLFPHIVHMDDELWDAFRNKMPAIDSVLAKYGLYGQKEKALSAYRFHKPDIRLYDGVHDMLERIRGLKKVGIITDGRPEGQRAKLEALGICVDEVIITDELGGVEYRKPNEAAFVLMSDRLCVSPGKMAYVGDNISKDFIAPEKLGIRSIYFTNSDGIYYKGTI